MSLIEQEIGRNYNIIQAFENENKKYLVNPTTNIGRISNCIPQHNPITVIFTSKNIGHEIQRSKAIKRW